MNGLETPEHFIDVRAIYLPIYSCWVDPSMHLIGDPVSYYVSTMVGAPEVSDS